MAKTIVITEADRARLSQVLDVSHSFGDDKMGQCLRELNSDLEKAEIVDASAVPQDIVTMNSRVILRDLASNEEEEWVLSFPQNADIFENRLSVLAPMGIALLGTSPGDTIEWDTPKGTARAEVVKISYQPEASGDYHL
jgi:regulator of nucleoside diphosphate kinase